MIALKVLTGLIFITESARAFLVPTTTHLSKQEFKTVLSASPKRNYDGKQTSPLNNGRRNFLATTPTILIHTLAFTSLLVPQNAMAGIDPSLLKTIPVEGDTSGTATRLRQIELEKNRPEDTVNIPYIELPSGASYREYREGKGDATVQIGSKVAVEATVRCRSFATANEPGGLKYFSTKEDTEFNELAWTVGSGELPPELEEGMIGMKRGAVRRIEIPSTAAYAAKKAGQLPLPKEGNKDGKRRFENVFKTDATLLFEVLVTRIK